MYLAIIILPLLGSIASGFFGRKIGVTGAQTITCTAVVLTTVLAVYAFFEVGLNNIPVSIQAFRWIDVESLYIWWGFHFDSLTVSMLLPVLIISSLVHIYSIGYMSNDPHNQRFFSYLSLFTFMMIILVTADNFLLMFVGWEGVGVCSYLLVCFWYTRIAANQSSLSAFLTNRVGDCFLTIGMFAILWSFGNLDYTTVFSLAPYMNENVVTIIGICLLIGAMAKSSQVGLHVWLPMAMEGPTPVSALIHAATMVTAGVYLLIRSSPLIEYSSTVLILCLWLGAITTVFSSLIGLFQQDIKKVIAYSTMSQLGMMVIAVGLSCYSIALFHLINHAFYKGLLFLGAGSVIHAVADNQDFRRYGGLRSFLPLTYSVMLIASLSLVAFPFMTGFYSKDFILESAYGQFNFSSTVVYIIATIGAMFTTLYSIKVLYLAFLTNPNGPIINYKQAHEGDIFMSLPLIILAIFSIFFGYITKDIFIGLGSGFFGDNALFIHPSHEIMLDTEFGTPVIFKLLPLVFTLLLSIISIILSEYLSSLLIYFKLSRIGYNIFSFFNQRFLIELFYNNYITNFILKLGGQTTKVLDKGSVEFLGPYGLEKGLLNLGTRITKLDSGLITGYALYILTSLVFYMLFYVYFGGYISLFLLLIYLIFTINKYSIYIISREQNIQIVESKSIFGYLLVVPQLCIYYLKILKDRSFPGLEWALDNPPKAHAFTSLPLQSMPYDPPTHRYVMEAFDPATGKVVTEQGDNLELLRRRAESYNYINMRITDRESNIQTASSNSNVQTQNTTVSTSNTGNTSAEGSTYNIGNTSAVASSSNTGNTPARGSSFIPDNARSNLEWFTSTIDLIEMQRGNRSTLSKVYNIPAAGSSSNTGNTTAMASSSNTGNTTAVPSTSNTGNTSAVASSSNTGNTDSDSGDSLYNLLPISFPISNFVFNLYRFIKLHPIYSSDLEIYENKILNLLNKFYFKSNNIFNKNIILLYLSCIFIFFVIILCVLII